MGKELYSQIPEHIKPRENEVLVITGCTQKKRKETEPIWAFDRYIGPSSRSILELYEARKSFDLYVLSAGYGLIKANEKIVDYNITFNRKNKNTIKAIVEEIQLGKDFNKLLSLGYKVIFLRLGSEYYKALKLSNEKRFQTSSTIKYIKTKSNHIADNLFENIRPYELNEKTDRNFQTLCVTRTLTEYTSEEIVQTNGSCFDRVIKEELETLQH